VKEQTKGSGFPAPEISAALKSLERSGQITFDPGPRGAKYWRLTLPDDLGQIGQMTLPTLPDPARHGPDGSVHPALLIQEGRVNGAVRRGPAATEEESTLHDQPRPIASKATNPGSPAHRSTTVLP